MYKQVIIARQDLDLEPGRMAAQVAHAAVGAVANNMEHPDVIEWLENHFTKIVLGVDSLEHLAELRYDAEKIGLITNMMVENYLPGFEQEEYGIPTALAIGPHFGKKIDSITGKLPLYK